MTVQELLNVLTRYPGKTPVSVSGTISIGGKVIAAGDKAASVQKATKGAGGVGAVAAATSSGPATGTESGQPGV